MSMKNVFKINEQYDSYEEAVQASDITPKIAKREIERHGVKWEEFVAEVGEKPVYTGKEILDWLGY
jgi:hypothetical protein